MMGGVVLFWSSVLAIVAAALASVGWLTIEDKKLESSCLNFGTNLGFRV